MEKYEVLEQRIKKLERSSSPFIVIVFAFVVVWFAIGGMISRYDAEFKRLEDIHGLKTMHCEMHWFLKIECK